MSSEYCLVRSFGVGVKNWMTIGKRLWMTIGISELPAATSTERLEILDDDRHVLSFSVVRGDHRLTNFRSVTTLHPKGDRTVVVESYVVDTPAGNTREETCVVVESYVVDTPAGNRDEAGGSGVEAGGSGDIKAVDLETKPAGNIKAVDLETKPVASQAVDLVLGEKPWWWKAEEEDKRK